MKQNDAKRYTPHSTLKLATRTKSPTATEQLRRRKTIQKWSKHPQDQTTPKQHQETHLKKPTLSSKESRWQACLQRRIACVCWNHVSSQCTGRWIGGLSLSIPKCTPKVSATEHWCKLVKRALNTVQCLVHHYNISAYSYIFKIPQLPWNLFDRTSQGVPFLQHVHGTKRPLSMFCFFGTVNLYPSLGNSPVNRKKKVVWPSVLDFFSPKCRKVHFCANFFSSFLLLPSLRCFKRSMGCLAVKSFFQDWWWFTDGLRGLRTSISNMFPLFPGIPTPRTETKHLAAMTQQHSGWDQDLHGIGTQQNHRSKCSSGQQSFRQERLKTKLRSQQSLL